MAQARSAYGAAALHGELWAVGGGAWEDADQSFHGIASVEVYSPRLNTWRAGVPLPHTCFNCTCVAVQR